jgi:hypothetical protein
VTLSRHIRRIIQPISGRDSEHTVNTHHEDEQSVPKAGYRGHDVVDPSHRLIGTISDVVYDSGGPRWAVVDLGLLRSSHFLPISPGYMSEAGEFVVPYDKRIVKRAPKADRRHLVDSRTSQQLERHYELI